MFDRIPSRSPKMGLPPGTPMYVGPQRMATAVVTRISYNVERCEATAVADLDALAANRAPGTITWLNVAGLHQIDVVEAVGRAFHIHPLRLEDTLQTDQRPKVELDDESAFIVLKMLHWLPDEREVETEQISLYLGPDFVVTFQEHEKDIFDPVRQRLREGKGRLRKSGPDYLAYALLDILVDHYFLILENIGEAIEEIEEELIADADQATLQKIHRLKREMLFLRRSVWPLREVIGALQRGESALLQPETLLYLRDVYEHTIQVIDTVETYRDIIAGLLDIYLSSISNKMNEVMKVLTVIATIFIPLTFITSIYGMNFVVMPELQWRWGYTMVWVAIVTLSASMLLYFRRRDWL